MILIVDMNYKKDSLGFYEFALPIASAIKKFDGCEIKHYSEIDAKDMKNYDRVILSGATLKNMEFSKDLGEFEWVKSFNKPILGICAGMTVHMLMDLFGNRNSRPFMYFLTFRILHRFNAKNLTWD